MLKNETIILKNEMALKGTSACATSQALEIPKTTAAKYMSDSPKQHGFKGIKKPSILNPYKFRITELMHLGIFPCVRILEDIQLLSGY